MYKSGLAGLNKKIYGYRSSALSIFGTALALLDCIAGPLRIAGRSIFNPESLKTCY